MCVRVDGWSGKQSIHSVAVDVIRAISIVCSGEKLCRPIREELLYGAFALD